MSSQGRVSPRGGKQEQVSEKSGSQTPKSETGKERMEKAISVVSLISEEEDGREGTSEDGKRKRGRPPTTGEYVGMAAAKERYLEAKAKETELEREQRIMALTGEELFQAVKLDLEEAIDEAKHNPSGDLASRARKLLAKVLKVSKTCSNMQGKQRGALKKAALVATATVEVLRTRADFGPETDTSVQLQALKDQLEESERERRRALERINSLEKTLQDYMMNEGKKRTRGARKVIASDSDSSDEERGTLTRKARQKSPSLSPRKRSAKKQQSPKYVRSIEMEVEDTGAEFPPSSSGAELPPRDQWPPVVRPPI